jgi:hypothetical protein
VLALSIQAIEKSEDKGPHLGLTYRAERAGGRPRYTVYFCAKGLFQGGQQRSDFMGRRSAFTDDEGDFDIGELVDEEYDADEDALPSTQIVIRRIVDKPISIQIEATIGEDSTFIKFWRTIRPESFKFCFLDTLDPDMILDTLEGKFENGLIEGVEDFFDKYGRTISDPVRFRLKLDAIVTNTDSGSGRSL